MVHININWFPNKVKEVIQYIFILLNFIIFIFGIVNFAKWSNNIDPYEINRGEYLPEFKINYNSFKDDVFNSSGICIVMLLLSLLTAKCKKPFYSFLY